MAARRRTLTLDAARRHVEERAFALDDHSPPRVGIEAEWLVVDLDDRRRRVVFDELRAATHAVPRPGGCRLTFEPGGQLELSSPPRPGVGAALASVRADVAVLAAALAPRGLGLVGIGLDPLRPPVRVVDSPRYRAMEAYFDAEGSCGRTMMCGTAAVQVNLDAGSSGELERRWRRVHGLGPVLAATFANSPLANGAPSGWRSTRLMIWSRIDPGRTAPVGAHNGSARRAWADYALAARVMLVRAEPDHAAPVVEPLAFAEWVVGGHDLGYPTRDDLEYHLTTLFPPVRPRGWLELRMIDALPDPWWAVAAAVATALLDDPEAASVAERAVATSSVGWADAARDALAHPGLARTARECFEAALDALARLRVDPPTVAAAEAFFDRYVALGRCPADDRLDEWAAARDTPPAEHFADATWA